MKGYCPKCKEEVDEVEFTQFGMCVECYKKMLNSIQEKINKGEVIIIDLGIIEGTHRYKLKEVI